MRRGFTLIELLVVVSIIALLISILLPALRSARNMALSVQCASNLRQIGLGFGYYGHDHDDYLPHAYASIGAPNGMWQHRLAPYLGATGDSAPIFECPRADWPWPDWADALSGWYLHYGFNYNMSRPGSPDRWVRRYKVHDRILVADGSRVPSWPSLIARQSPLYEIDARHHNAGNVLYGDGHVTPEPHEAFDKLKW